MVAEESHEEACLRRLPCWCLTLSLALSMAPAALAQVPAGGEVQVTAGAPGYQFASGVASDASGNFVVVWLDTSVGENSRGQRFDRTGARVGGEFQVNTTDNGAPPPWP